MRSGAFKKAFLVAACLTTAVVNLRWGSWPIEDVELPHVKSDTLTRLHSRDFLGLPPSLSANVSSYFESPALLHITKRQAPIAPATEAQVNAATCKGQLLLANVNAESYPASVWTEEAECDDYGWLKTKTYQIADDFEPLKGAFEYLEIPGKGDESWTRIKWTMQGADFEGTFYPPNKDAKYINLFNPKYKTIIAADNESPAYTDPPQYPLVPLKQWSDIAFLTWQQLCKIQNLPVSGLDRIIRINIINKQTLALMESVLRDERSVPTLYYLGGWDDAEEFIQGDDGFDALLATPNAAGIAWFLAQHKAELGQKTIKRITIWDDSNAATRQLYEPLPCMMLQFG